MESISIDILEKEKEHKKKEIKKHRTQINILSKEISQIDLQIKKELSKLESTILSNYMEG